MDKARIAALMKAVLEPIKENYQRGPASHDRVLEALNALAASTAIVILGTEEDPKAIQFFLAALEQNIHDNREDAQKKRE